MLLMPGRGLLGTLGGTRTPNLLVRSQTLYPLSYEGACGPCTLKYTSPISPPLTRAGERRRLEREANHDVESTWSDSQ